MSLKDLKMFKTIVFHFKYFFTKETDHMWYAWFRVAVFFVAVCNIFQTVLINNLVIDLHLFK